MGELPCFPFKAAKSCQPPVLQCSELLGLFAFSGLGYGGAGCSFAVVGLASRPLYDLPATAGGCHCAQFCEFWQALRQNCLLKKSAEKFGSGDDLRDSLMHQTGSLLRRLATGLVSPPISGLLRTGSVWWRATAIVVAILQLMQYQLRIQDNGKLSCTAPGHRAAWR